MEYIFYGVIAISILRALMVLFTKIKNKHSVSVEDSSDIPYSKNEVIEYSREKSVELGKRKAISGEEVFIRPSLLKRKGLSELYRVKREQSKAKNTKYAKLLKQYISLDTFLNDEDIHNKTIRVFIDSIDGTTYTVRDDSAVYTLLLKNAYDIAGDFVLINLSRNGGEIKENHIMYDN